MVPDLASLQSVFASYPVIAAYLFGSQASGATSPLSDIDIAVLLEPGTPSPGTVQVELISDLMLVLCRSDVDVVVLNTAPPLLKERAISGRLLYCRDEHARRKLTRCVLPEKRDDVRDGKGREVHKYLTIALICQWNLP